MTILWRRMWHRTSIPIATYAQLTILHCLNRIFLSIYYIWNAIRAVGLWRWNCITLFCWLYSYLLILCDFYLLWYLMAAIFSGISLDDIITETIFIFIFRTFNIILIFVRQIHGIYLMFPI